MKRPFKKRGKVYHNGTQVPLDCDLDAFNVGYYLGIKHSDNIDHMRLIASFKCGLVQGVAFRLKCSMSKLGKKFNVSGHTIKRWRDFIY